MKYVKIFLVLLMVPFVSAASCDLRDIQPASSLPGLTLEQRAFALNEEFRAVVKLAREYADQPVCTEVLIVSCSEPDVIDALAEAARKGRTTLDVLIAIARVGTPEGSPEGSDALKQAREGLREFSFLFAERTTS